MPAFAPDVQGINANSYVREAGALSTGQAPYEDWKRHEPALAEVLPDLLADDGFAVVETDERVEPELPLSLVTSRRYGSARITVFSR